MEFRPIPLPWVRASRIGVARGDLLVVALVTIAVLWLNPVGFIGGGADDTQYLTAARCWVDAGGPCLATVHWATRWPVIAPLATALALFGEQRWAISLFPLVVSSAALVSLIAIGNRLFGRPVGAIAASLLAMTPVFAVEMLDPAVDTTELALQLAAIALALRAVDRSSPWSAFAAGLSIGLAMETRETSFMFAALAAPVVMLLAWRRCRALAWMLPAMLLPALAETLAYWAATGEPAYRFMLSLHHVRVFTSELPPGFDTSQSPLFNPSYIEAWSREAGIRLAWPIDPWLNLAASKMIGATLAAAALLAVVVGRSLRHAQRRAAGLIVTGALTYSMLLVYALAIDPKSRMFLLLASAASLAAAALVVAGWRNGHKLLIVAAVATLAFFSAMVIGMFVETRTSDAVIARWVGEHRGEIEIHPGTRSLAALVPAVRAIPDAPAGRHFRIVKTTGSCAELVRPAPGQPQRADVVERHAMDGARWFDNALNNFCLLRYRAEEPSS